MILRRNRVFCVSPKCLSVSLKTLSNYNIPVSIDDKLTKLNATSDGNIMIMGLIANGSGMIKDLEKSGSLAVYVPLEGGFEGRYQRRLRIAGYGSYNITARGLGDLAAYLTGVHGVRPPHLGKKTTGNEACVGYVYYLPPIVNTQVDNLPPKSKGLVLWIMEGFVLSRQEVEYLTILPTLEPRVKVVVEMGGDRAFRWTSLKDALITAA
jgi:NAD(P)H-quinone oxidoreductase subunit N